MPQISVIMPVCNTKEEYLKEAIDSVLNQTFSDLELLVIDDGSTNNVKEVTLSYSDKRIKYFYQYSKGPGGARNLGIKHAAGRYILFVDSDDFVDMQACEKLYYRAEEKNPDIMFFGAYTFDTKENKIGLWDDLTSKQSGFFSIPEVENLFKLNNTCWAKLFKTEFLIGNNLLFEENLIFEDTEFFFRYIFKAKSLYIFNENLYFYRKNMTESVTINKNQRHLDVIKILNLIENNLKNNNIFEKLLIQFHQYKYITINYTYNRINNQFKPYLKELILKELKKDKRLLGGFEKISRCPEWLYKILVFSKYRAKFFQMVKLLKQKRNTELKKKVVRVEISWKGDDKRHNFETNDIKITTDKVKKCDLFVALNGAKNNVNIKAKQAWVFTFEPPNEDVFGVFKEKFVYYDRAYTSFQSTGNDNIINKTMLSEWWIGKDYDELMTLKPQEKKDEVVWVTSNIDFLEGHRQRLKFIDYVQKNTDYKVYGKGIDPVESKYEVYKDVKYILGVENTYTKDYWTEKIADSYLAYCMPIYYGCPNITDYFPKEAMIIIDIEEPEEAKRIIQDAIDNDLYNKNFKYILEAREIVLKKLWVYPFIVDEIRKTDFDKLECKNYKIPKHSDYLLISILKRKCSNFYRKKIKKLLI